jgi:5-methylcytosine-specific restriction endonuclease McrA
MTSVHHLCEDCLAAGRYTPAEIVHHRIELTPENISNPAITMDFSNLKAVCRECHLKEHGINQKRFIIMPDGRVEIRNFGGKYKNILPPD